MEFKTSFSGANFQIKGDILIKQGRNLYESGLMQLKHQPKIFHTPLVFGLGNDHIAMEYLNDAVCLPDYLNACTRGQAEDIAYDIITFVKENKTRQTFFIRPDVMTAKIEHIVTRLSNYDDIELAQAINDAFGKSPIEIEIGDYHGDLTFTNILVDANGKPYIIDFLPGYAPTYWLDVVKLQQECHLNWSNYFVIGGDNYYHAIEIIREYIAPFFKGKHARTLRLMEALNYLRILPYAATNCIIADMLRTTIKNILK